MPQLLDYESAKEYSTLISKFDNGMEQRRVRFPRAVGSWKFNFDVSSFSPEQRKKIEDEIQTFHDARQGSYDNFYLPSWEFEYSLAAPTGATTIPFGTTSPASLGFSSVDGGHGSLVFLCDAWYLKPGMTTKQTIAKITPDSSFGSSPNYSISVEWISGDAILGYVAGAHVQKAFKVRFVDDRLVKAHVMPYIWKSPIEFVEDVGGY